jgi:hypothetical protein
MLFRKARAALRCAVVFALLALSLADPARATIGVPVSSVTASGNGSTTTFSYSFPVTNLSEIVVIYTPPGGTPGIVPATGYTVNNFGTSTVSGSIGGTVTYTIAGSPIPVGSTLTIERVVQYLQTTSISNQGAFYPQAVEAALDYLTMQTQQLAQQIGGMTPLTGDLSFFTAEPPNGTARTLAAHFSEVADVLDYGAQCDGATDDTNAFTRAAASGASVVTIPPGTVCFTASGLVYGGYTIMSQGLLPGNPAMGARIKCALSVAVCVQIGTGGNNGTSGLAGISVIRAAGTPPVGSVGIKVLDGYNTQLVDVNSVGHYDCYYFRGDGSNGISIHARGLYSANCSDFHVVDDSIPEVYIDGGRLGANGSLDVNSNGYIKITGTNVNTLMVNQLQCNQGGSTSAANWLDFTAITGGGSTSVLYSFANMHIEAIGTAGIASDSGVSIIDRLMMTNIDYASPSNPFFALNAATQPSQWEIGNSFFAASNFTLAPTPQITSLGISNVRLVGTTSLTGASGSTASLSNVSFGGNVTLAGTWGNLSVNGGELTAGSITNTAAGKWSINIPGKSTFPWTPTFLIGGVDTGTETSQLGSYSVNGGFVTATFDVIISAKAGTGAITIGGLPLPSSPSLGTGGASIPVYSGFTGLTAGLLTEIGSNVTAIKIEKPGATGVTQAADTDLGSGTVEIRNTVVYPQ